MPATAAASASVADWEAAEACAVRNKSLATTTLPPQGTSIVVLDLRTSRAVMTRPSCQPARSPIDTTRLSDLSLADGTARERRKCRPRAKGRGGDNRRLPGRGA